MKELSFTTWCLNNAQIKRNPKIVGRLHIVSVIGICFFVLFYELYTVCLKKPDRYD